jgi:hypothetical protein
MADSETEWEPMLEEVILLAFCALVALIGLALVLWEVASGRLLSLDSLTLTFICLTLVVIFGGNLAWAVYNGDVKRILNHLRKRSAESEIKSA